MSDELEDARAVVAAKRPEREQLREDWAYYKWPEEVLADEVDRLEAEWGQLKVERDHYHRFGMMVGEIVRRVSEDIPSIDIETLLRDMPDNVAAIRDERNRLRTEVEGWRAENDRHRSLYVAAVKERDELRLVINNLRAMSQSIVDDGCTDEAYDEGNLSAWTYVLLYVENGLMSVALDVSSEEATGG